MTDPIASLPAAEQAAINAEITADVQTLVAQNMPAAIKAAASQNPIQFVQLGLQMEAVKVEANLKSELAAIEAKAKTDLADIEAKAKTLLSHPAAMVFAVALTAAVLTGLVLLFIHL